MLEFLLELRTGQLRTSAAACRKMEDRQESVLSLKHAWRPDTWAHGPHDGKARFRESQEVQMLGVQGAQRAGENMLRDRKK